eukprot:TRINITY_DN1951_c0_g1_i5.p1 TRINITY_DN1951_c0_g1~~TRINITY_DN1951_c0_g1_i5.p1  ORF type:complete len:130 (+),score=10.70 TRINITY_DN1951_c0_g1_i5:202-591(+)
MKRNTSAGCGATQNNKKLMTFDLEGQMAPGGVFRWKKTFSYHTTLYTGKLNIELGTLTGTLDYQDQTTAWEASRKLSSFFNVCPLIRWLARISESDFGRMPNRPDVSTCVESRSECIFESGGFHGCLPV